MSNKPNKIASRIQTRRVLLSLLVTCAGAALTACATLGNQSAEELVSQRANQRWQYLVAGDFAKAYAFSTSGYRAVVTEQGFRGRVGSAVTWVGAETINVTCSDEIRCVARVRLDYKPILRGRVGDKYSTHLDETWLREDGQWWIFQDLK